MNLKQEFSLRKLINEEILLDSYLSFREQIERGGKEFKNWIENLYQKVIFDKKNAMRYYEHLLYMEEKDIRERIEFIRKEIERIKNKYKKEQEINLW